MPFRSETGIKFNSKLSVRLPSGWLLEGGDDKPLDMDGAFGKARISFLAPSDATESVARGSLDLSSLVKFSPPEQYAKFCESRQAILDAWTIPVILKKAGN